jgi:hypothetical protein
MPKLDLTLEIAPVHSEASPNGGVRFSSSHQGRTVFGVCRRIPGRLVHVQDVAGERRVVGWTAIDTETDLLTKALDLTIWVSTGRRPGRDEQD